MTKWYEETDQMHDVFVMKRLRLVRNVDGHVFPEILSPEEREALLSEMEGKLLPITTEDGVPYEYRRLNEMNASERTALFERRLDCPELG